MQARNRSELYDNRCHSLICSNPSGTNNRVSIFVMFSLPVLGEQLFAVGPFIVTAYTRPCCPCLRTHASWDPSCNANKPSFTSIAQRASPSKTHMQECSTTVSYCFHRSRGKRTARSYSTHSTTRLAVHRKSCLAASESMVSETLFGT